MPDPCFHPALPLADMPDETAQTVRVAGTAILLVRSEGTVHAVAPICSHADEPLACGRVKRGWIACPAHGARFDLATGEPLGPPADAAIATWPTRIVDGMIEVEV